MKTITKNLTTFYSEKGYEKYLQKIAGKTIKEQATITRELITLIFPCNNQVIRYYYLWRTKTLHEDDWEFLRKPYVITRFKELQKLEENDFKTFKALMYNISMHVPYNGAWKYNKYIAQEFEDEAKRICKIWEYPDTPTTKGVPGVKVYNSRTGAYYGVVDVLGSIVNINNEVTPNPLPLLDTRCGAGSFLIHGGDVSLVYYDEDKGTCMVNCFFKPM